MKKFFSLIFIASTFFFNGCAEMNTPEFANAMRDLNQRQEQYNQQYDTDRRLRQINSSINNYNSSSKLQNSRFQY